MLFNVSTGVSGQPGESFLISGSSWASCVAYFEGLGKNLISIVLTDDIVIKNNTSDVCFLVSMRDNLTNTAYRYTIYDSFDNVAIWLNSQSDKTIQTLTKQNKQFVTI